MLDCWRRKQLHRLPYWPAVTSPTFCCRLVRTKARRATTPSVTQPMHHSDGNSEPRDASKGAAYDHANTRRGGGGCCRRTVPSVYWYAEVYVRDTQADAWSR